MDMTITEALAEVKTIGKRLKTKAVFILTHLARQEALKDPLANEEGGSVGAIQRERQGILDLENRLVRIRSAIQQRNQLTLLTIDGTTRTVAEWLNWRKEVAPGQKEFLAGLTTRIGQMRGQAQQKGVAVIMASASAGADPKPTDLWINVDEAALGKESEQLETTLGTLDGKLSLLNATTTITIPD